MSADYFQAARSRGRNASSTRKRVSHLHFPNPLAGTIAAILAVVTMVSMSIAGLLAASRFPLR